MAKPPKNASPNVRTEENAVALAAGTVAVLGSAELDLAAALQLDLTASPDVRTERAVHAYNLATRHMVEAGLLLASVRDEVGAEAFGAVLEERGMAKQRAYELMRGAALVARLSGADRERVMALGKTKVVLLANASASVVEAALEADDELNVDLLSVRALHARIQELEAATVDLQVQRDTAETEAEGLRKKLKRGLPERADQVPHVVADLRAEIVALGRKAQLAIDSFKPLGTEIVSLGAAGAHDWQDATLRLAASQLAALGFQIEGVLTMYLGQLPERDPRPVKLSELTKAEVLEAAQACATLTQAHQYEAALREWQREQDRPRGKGRPKDKPVPPPGVEGGAA